MLLRCQNKFVWHEGCLSIREQYMCGASCLLSQFQALMPNWCLMNGLKNKLHLPGAAALLLSTQLPLERLNESQSHKVLSLIRYHTFWGVTGCLHEGWHLASIACMQCSCSPADSLPYFPSVS